VPRYSRSVRRRPAARLRSSGVDHLIDTCLLDETRSGAILRRCGAGAAVRRTPPRSRPFIEGEGRPRPSPLFLNRWGREHQASGSPDECSLEQHGPYSGFAALPSPRRLREKGAASAEATPTPRLRRAPTLEQPAARAEEGTGRAEPSSAGLTAMAPVRFAARSGLRPAPPVRDRSPREVEQKALSHPINGGRGDSVAGSALRPLARPARCAGFR